MRVLFTIPHFFQPAGKAPDGRRYGSLRKDPRPRITALTRCLAALHQLYAGPQCIIDLSRRKTRPANQQGTCEIEVVVCTTQGRHLLDELPLGAEYYTHCPTEAVPLLLGFECQAVLRDRIGGFDYYCFLEDDLILHDPWLFTKLGWFTRHVGDAGLLQPNRFELGQNRLVQKAYIDGDLPKRATRRFQDVAQQPQVTGSVLDQHVVFRRPSNPHSACYFLNASQMEQWSRQPHFLDRDTSFIGPLESAATLGVMRTFRIYKPAPENASFLEIEHFGTAFLGNIRPGDSAQADTTP